MNYLNQVLRNDSKKIICWSSTIVTTIANVTHPLEIKANTPTAMSKTAAELNSEDFITEILRRQAGSTSKREKENGIKSVIWIDDLTFFEFINNGSGFYLSYIIAL